MRASDLEKFSNLFLFLDGDQAVVKSYGQQDKERAKRPHTKSRNGCLACKRRRVKCDERLPCGHCVNRREKCERPGPRPQAKVEVPQQPSSPSHHVNILHIELFNHFEKVTQFTLAFPEIWETMLQESFKHEYLMHAILATAAKHMSVLRPQYPRYAEAAIVLLNKSIQSFRGTLDTPITHDNCEARLGTSTLINYIMWTELGFLEGQSILTDPEAGGLDMSKDLLFLLGSGVRQVFYSAFPIFKEHDSPFIAVGKYHPCDNLQEEADKRGTKWREIMRRLIYLFDDPSYQGSPNQPPSPSTQEASPSPCVMDLDTSAFQSPETHSSSSAAASPSGPVSEWTESCNEDYLQRIIERTKGPVSGCTASCDEDYLQRIIERTDNSARSTRYILDSRTARSIYERISQRLAVLVSFIPEDGSEMVPLPVERQLDIERYCFSFPTLCIGPFLPLILENDSRALVVLYHTYRAANRLLPFDKTWWAVERAATMEKLTLVELKARGLSADLY
ncbi:hypothetical protein CONLIGDRAFT_648368 [Coniochaeta ligniaria NRRL 30616]|uniref:Zn(2)-C6 fungal-type domain-containing protein n=1 Tax=Coniochaeta ligniaria NRRL 30616 TaxID=1408157 RepID=A0A1J7IDG4_9PEZI|nr:hypothetical protein CONLIGDRAFT_648368 [Coniochaeta ligniaria NRRL 30616]